MRSALGSCGLLLLGACWFNNFALDVDKSLDDNPAQGPVTTDPVEPEIAETGPELPHVPELDDPDFLAPISLRVALESGLKVCSRTWASPGPAFIQLTIPTDGRHAARCYLTAATVARAPGGASGRPALEAAIERLGGVLELEVDAFASTFRVIVPAAHWRDAMAALAKAVMDTPTSRQQVELVQTRLLRELSRAMSADPIGAAIARAVGGSPGARALLEGIQDLDVSNVAVFHKLAYLPGASILAIAVPEADPAECIAAASTVFSDWEPGEVVAERGELDLEGKLFWVVDDAIDDVALLRQFPEPSGLEAAAEMVVRELVTRDGVGGRFGAALRETFGAELGFRSQPLTIGATRLQLLSTTSTGPIALHASAAFDEALVSLRRQPPSQPEIERAANRAKLKVLRTVDDPIEWLASAVQRTLESPDPVPEFDAGAVEDGLGEIREITTTLNGLDAPLLLDLEEAVLRLLEHRPTMVGLGNPIDEADADRVILLEDVMPTADKLVLRADEEQRLEAAKEVVERMIEAFGGPARVAAISSFRAVGVTRTGVGPDSTDRVAFDAKSMRYHRSREILKTRIDGAYSTAGGSETSGSIRIDIDQGTAENAVASGRRHPLILAAECARGEATYRLLDERRLHERRIAVLELADPTRERLRLHVDFESGLIRAVDTLERRDVGVVFVRDEYRDYRDAAGVRVPFYRATFIDDSARGVVTEWTEFEPNGW